MLLADDTGRQLDGSFHLSGNPGDGHFSIVLDHSAGPNITRPLGRNRDYAEVLELLLRRLAEIDAVLSDCLVESRTTADLGDAERRISPEPWNYPLRLREVDDFNRLRRILTGNQRQIASVATTGGNNRKRIRLLLTAPEPDLTSGRLLMALGTVNEDEAEVGLETTLEATSQDDAASPKGDPLFWREPPEDEGSAGNDLPQHRRPRPSARGETVAIANHAVAIARGHFEALEWKVKSVGANHSFDLICRRGDRVLHVEVKGTKGAGRDVSLYPWEVNHARGCKAELALFVVNKIDIRHDGEAVYASGGNFTVLMPWIISDEIAPSEYRCPLPLGTSWAPCEDPVAVSDFDPLGKSSRKQEL